MTHYSNDSATAEWLSAMRKMEAEGERTPAQTERTDADLDDSHLPALVRRQAA